MPLPTTDVIFEQARIVDFWVTYPMSRYNDTVTKVYNYRCQVNAANYATLSKGALMTSATSAGVISIPFTDANARFCSDTPTNSISGGVIEFVRTFANIPAAYTTYSSGVETKAPQYGEKQTITLYSTLNGDPLRTKKTYPLENASQTSVVAARVEYSFTITPDTETTLTAESFEISTAAPSTYSDTYLGYPVTVEDEGAVTVNVLGDANVLEGTKIEEWRGDIYRVTTTYKV